MLLQVVGLCWQVTLAQGLSNGLVEPSLNLCHKFSPPSFLFHRHRDTRILYEAAPCHLLPPTCDGLSVFVSLQNSRVEILAPKVMVLGDGPLGTPESSYLFLLQERCSKEMASCELRSGRAPHTSSTRTLILDFPGLRLFQNWKNKRLSPSLWYFCF